MPGVDPATADVRDHIEKVVESLVGGEIDSVNIVRLSKHPHCKFNCCQAGCCLGVRGGIPMYSNAHLWYSSNFSMYAMHILHYI